MHDLKVYSIRLEIDSIAWADKLADDVYCWTRSDVIRLAILIGRKVINSNNASALARLMWQERYGGRKVSLDDVLRTGDVECSTLK